MLGLVGSKHESDDSWKSLQRHRDEDQVELDVNRSFVYYPAGEPYLYAYQEVFD